MGLIFISKYRMRITKRYLFGLIMIVMLASPLAKIPIDIFNFTIAPLRGYVNYNDKPEFTWESCFSGEYQTNFDSYLEDHIGLRNLLVRLFNQLDLSLFHKGHAAGVTLGKENYLYELNYIEAYTGVDFLGDEFIEEKCKKIISIQKELKKYDTDLIIVFPPGKASYFPEYIPDKYLKYGIGPNNQNTFLRHFHEMGIQHIDFNSLFIAMKDTTTYPLYPKCGIHWTDYGSYFALDSIVSYVEEVKGIDMVDFGYEKIEMSSDLKNTDYDIGDAMNLIFRIPDRPMPYLYGFYSDTVAKTKPDMMVIADSYYWSIYRLRYSFNVWDEHHFRFYNQMLFYDYNKNKDAEFVNLEELKRFDVIILMYTEATMKKFANDFIESSYILLKHGERFEEIINSIRGTDEWLEKVEEKAEKRGITVDEMIRIDAEWVLENEINKEKHLTITGDGI